MCAPFSGRVVKDGMNVFCGSVVVRAAGMHAKNVFIYKTYKNRPLKIRFALPAAVLHTGSLLPSSLPLAAVLNTQFPYLLL